MTVSSSDIVRFLGPSWFLLWMLLCVPNSLAFCPSRQGCHSLSVGFATTTTTTTARVGSPSCPRARTSGGRGLPTLRQAKESAAAEAQRLLEKSRALRDEIAKQESERTTKTNSHSGSSSTSRQGPTTKAPTAVSKWAVPAVNGEHGDHRHYEYRLYVDIGREEGTWMEPRWGASGRRIEFTLDVRFLPGQLASEESRKKMVKDNQGGRSSPVYELQAAPYARLRGGFDEMKCTGGAYRIDQSTKPGQSDTLRFFVTTKGTSDSSYGDVSVPDGGLYFSIPCFGSSVAQLSSKGEMPVTVRQIGWHTGFRREESRILGIFKAVPIENARRKDGF